MPHRRALQAVTQTSRATRIRAFLVGGPLRDVLLGRPVQDVDVAVEGPPARFGAALARRIGGSFVHHPEFGTGTVRFGRQRIDIARTRTESYRRPAALPAVRPAGIDADLARRDFTINALACDLRTFELLDPFCGAEDLRRGLVRVLHDRSFRDDPTRVFRAARFSTRLGFAVEPHTRLLIEEARRRGALKLLSGARVLAELRQVAAADRPGAVLERLEEWGAWGALLGTRLPPELPRRLERLGDPPARLLLLLASLTGPGGPPARFLGTLPLTRGERAAVAFLRRYPPELRPRIVPARRPSRIYALLRNAPPDALRVLARLEAPAIAAKIAAYLDTWSKVKPDLDGRDLLALGLRPGPVFTRLLERLRSHKLDHGPLTPPAARRLVERWL